MTIAELAVAFFLTALLYSSVGFGGGSTYNALLALSLANISTVPIIALACNILVVSVGSWRFFRSGHIEWKRFLPLVILSVPAALLGGYLSVPPWLFVGLLALALAISGLLMLWQPLWRRQPNPQSVSSSKEGDLQAELRSAFSRVSPGSAAAFTSRRSCICGTGRAQRLSPAHALHSSSSIRSAV